MGNPSPDPVTQGASYRQMLIDLTKGEDPQRLQLNSRHRSGSSAS
ncbi:MAG: hypothetical protein ACYDCC_05900 [Actinomycetota bacterium]